MEKKEIDICCKYGFSVNMLIDKVECLIEDILYGEETTEKQVENLKANVSRVRIHEKPFKEMLDIQARKEKY